MRFPLSQALVDEAEHFQLRSACCHCFYFVAHTGLCAHEWPDRGQGRWPLGSGEPDPGEETVDYVEFCKEFELR